jgi:hypothetical protein
MLVELSPLVPVGAAIGGALVGAWGTHLLSLWRNKKQDEREKNGLLRMLLVEIRQNQDLLEAFKDQRVYIINAPPGILRWGVWEDARTRLAQLLEEEHALEDMAKCYEMIQQIEAFRLIDSDRLEDQEEGVIQQVEKHLDTAIGRCQVAAKHIQEYVPKAA